MSGHHSTGETTGDGRFTLLPSVCLGACDHAPALMIETICTAKLPPQKLDEILLEKYRLSRTMEKPLTAKYSTRT